jgi:L-amino acid N-acyltransferase YncA/protein-tyrosine-phosphatase
MSRPSVLFVCVHNAGRSQMAAGYLQHLGGDRVEVLSAGSQPADQINPVAVAAMAEEGIDIAAERPKPLTESAVREADVVVTMGCGDECPFFPGKRYEDWVLDDPAGQGIEAVRPIRDEIRRRVEALLDQLVAASVVPLTAEHWPEVERIYAAGIATGHATFESEPPTWDRFDASRLPDQRLVAVEGGRVVGWAAASPVSDRCVYAGVVEHSVYVDPAAGGRGIGRLLLDALVASTEAAGIWTIQSGVFPENTASLALHRSAGFREVGIRERVGLMTHGPLAGHWRDVVFLERRSNRAGT